MLTRREKVHPDPDIDEDSGVDVDISLAMDMYITGPRSTIVAELVKEQCTEKIETTVKGTGHG